MVAVERRRVVSVLLLLAALAAFVVGGSAAVDAAAPAYDHSVEHATGDEVAHAKSVDAASADKVVFAFRNLSADAREAFRAALESPDGTATVRGEGNRPPEFDYGDTAALGSGQFLVQYEGDYYVLYTSGEQFDGTLAALPVVVATLVVGGSALTAGLLLLAGVTPIRSTTTFLAGAAAVGGSALDVVGDPRIILVVFFVVAVVAWQRLERRGW